MKFEVTGIRLFHNDDGRHPYRTLATAEVVLPEFDLVMDGVRLTWSEDRGYLAACPGGPRNSSLTWRHKSPFGKALSARLVEMYQAIGGKMPDEPPVRRDHVTGRPIGPDPLEVAKAGGIERRVFPATFVVKEAKDDDTGLRAFLGADHVAETMEQAGL